MTPAQIIANLTAKERAVMKALYFNVYGERGCGVYSHLSDESMEPSGLPAASLPGVIASLVVEDGHATLGIEDDGVGLPARDRDRLTEPYVTTREKGTGLGLAIATEDVAIHGGRLQAYGEPGKGASFLMTLPKHPGDEIATWPLTLWEDE